MCPLVINLFLDNPPKYFIYYRDIHCNMKTPLKIFIIMSLLDIITTYIGLTYFDLTERNQFANDLFLQYDVLITMIILKILCILIIIPLFSLYKKEYGSIVWYPASTFMAIVVLNNVLLML